jgi:hypothetical protein
LEPGKNAAVAVVVGGDPLGNIDALMRIVLVIHIVERIRLFLSRPELIG